VPYFGNPVKKRAVASRREAVGAPASYSKVSAIRSRLGNSESCQKSFFHFSQSFQENFTELPLTLWRLKLMMVMSIGWDYVSKLHLPTVLVFIPLVLYENGVTWRNDIDCGKLLNCPSELWQSYQQSCSSKPGRTGGKIINFAARKISFMLWRVLLTCRKILRHGTDGFNSPRKERVLWIFIAVKNPLPLPIWTHEHLVQSRAR
jgi:hypothetical protein